MCSPFVLILLDNHSQQQFVFV